MSAAYPNINAPKGFIPVRYLNGPSYNGQHNLVLIPSADATAVFIGDVVKVSGTSGTAGTIVNGMDTEGMITCIRVATGATGQDIFGVVVGFLPDPTQLQLKYRLASTNRIAMVVPVHQVVFEVEEDAVTTPLAAVDVGLNISFSTTAGSTATGVSGMEIISAAKATTATLPCKILGLVKRPDNSFNTAGAAQDKAKFEVIFNTFFYADNTAGIA